MEMKHFTALAGKPEPVEALSILRHAVGSGY
jgi:hypothetical protein